MYKIITMKTTIAETNEFFTKSRELLSKKEINDFIDYIAKYPTAGVLIQGTGGVRKLRWKRSDTGKRGGFCIIYYFHSSHMPLYLLTVFAKGDKSDLTSGEKHELKVLVNYLVDYWFGD